MKITKIKQLERIVFNPSIKKQNNLSQEVLRIDSNNKLTRIDFIFYAPPYYINGGWIQISKDTFITPIGTDLKLKLVQAVNIPIAPKKHHFKSTKDVLCYTLFFPALPSDTKSINIIECETTIDNWFNFYDVLLDKIKTERLVINHS
jgi:hypothetical protein